MQLSAVILALAAAVTAQETITACGGKAQKCIEDAIAGSDACEEGDIACACQNIDEIQQEATPCVIEACGSADEAIKVVEEVKGVCASVA